MPPAYIGLAPDAPRYCSARCRPCGRRFAAYGRQSPLRLRSMAPPRSPSLRLRSRCALRSKKPLASSLRAPLTPAATGETCHWHLSPAVRLSRGSPHASLAHAVSARVCLRRLNRAHDPPDSAQRVESLCPVDARCTSLLTRQILGALAAMILPCGACSPGFRAPSARGSRLRRSRGLWPAFGRPPPLEYRRGVRVPEPERPFRRKRTVSGPFPGMLSWQAASLPPCRAPWRCPAWRSRGQGGCRPL